jgi:hypothetical protein
MAGQVFQSRFGAKKPLNSGQYLAENMLDRQARRRGVDLPVQFWKDKSLAKEFAKQIILANALLKLYSVEAIIKALRTTQGRKIYSFAAPFLPDLCRAQQEILDRQSKKEVIVPSKIESVGPIKQYVSPTILTKLRDL